MSIDLAAIGREIKKPVENIEVAIQLLDDGNTIPFITRFRKDQTGGLTEDQLLTIKTSVVRLRALAERKAFVSKSIDSQGKLSDAIKKQIESAATSRELEDVYLPFKPKKQTLATVAKQNGLEPLALDIFEGREPEKDLASRATDFVRVDKNLNSVDEVIAGVKHILAEKFSDNASLRNNLREIISKGALTTKLIEIETPAEPERKEKDEKTEVDKPETTPENDSSPSAAENDENPAEQESPAEDLATAPGVEVAASAEADATDIAEDQESEGSSSVESVSVPAEEKATAVEESQGTPEATANESPEPGAEAGVKSAAPESKDGAEKPKSGKKKKKKKKKAEDPYREFHEFSHPVEKMQYYKTLAINRGEKNGRLKVKIQFDEDEFLSFANNQLVSEDHPFKEFLHECVKDGMARLVAPSLERETRREITEAAEKHAVDVFARNLKNLLLQSPVRDHTVLAIDPGYKRGCSVAVLDCSGQLLAHEHVFVVGNEKRRNDSKDKISNLIKNNGVTLVAIGNGAACREAEQMISDMISEQFKDAGLKYAMVNEAGASFYSTSEVGREEFPELSPAVRSAVSIGRRLIDPLSELVKISPANIGVGLYQHDVKAKHLSESLDDVVQFCVNRVGVDVNTASTSLLKYVSGLNQLTARRVYECREEKGAFKNREQLKEVAGFGDATFVQSAGFLRIHRGSQPLDTTGIHPEHYETANKVIDKVGGSVEELFPLAVLVSREVVAAEVQPPVSVVSAETNESTESSPKPDSAHVESEKNTTANGASEETVVAASTEEVISDAPAVIDGSASAQDEKPETGSETDAPSSASNQIKSESEKVRVRVEPTLTKEQTQRRRDLVKAIRAIDVDKLAAELSVGKMMLQDIVHSICRPEYDPRNNVNRPVFRSGIIKLEDLTVEMELEAQVVNVVDFGVFVDIGLGTSCLVHVSQLANHFIRDPHRFYAVGDSLKVWVTEVDGERRRVKLTAVQPKSLRPKRSSEKKFERRGVKSKFKKPRNQSSNQYKQKRKSKPKPVKPITKDMLTGAEPMRSFSDLAQFFDKKPEEKSGDDAN